MKLPEFSFWPIMMHYSGGCCCCIQLFLSVQSDMCPSRFNNINNNNNNNKIPTDVNQSITLTMIGIFSSHKSKSLSYRCANSPVRINLRNCNASILQVWKFLKVGCRRGPHRVQNFFWILQLFVKTFSSCNFIQ